MKGNGERLKNLIYKLISVLFWLGVWQVVAMVYGMDFLIPSPVDTFVVLMEKITLESFWSAIYFSVSRIMIGFLLSCLAGGVLALIGIRVSAVRILFDPFCSVVRAVPVASFIILVLVMFSSKNVSPVISFLMGFPVVYSTVSKGCDCAPVELLECAKIYEIGYFSRLRLIYLPHLAPFFSSALSVSCGLCFKRGIAAEVIGYPRGSVGEAMYLSKVGFDMPTLLSYTAVIVVVSVLIEKLITRLCSLSYKSKGV